MKKLNIIILTLGVIAVMLSSCKKDKPSQITESPQTNYTAEDIRIQNLILNFQNKIKNNSFKNGETVSVDSAIWFLEAMMNYNYSTPDSSYVNLTVDTTFEFDLPVNNDLVDFSNLTEAAFAMESHILTYLNNMPNSIKFIIAADVSVKPNALKDGTKTITITTGYGSEYIVNPGCYTPFGANDFWKFGMGDLNNGGYCDGPNQGQATNSDAGEQIQYKINNPNCQAIWQNAYYTNFVTVASEYWDGSSDYTFPIFEYPNVNDDIPNDGWLDYLTLYVNSYYDCLEPTEMNFYLQGNLDIIESERQKLITNTGLSYKFLYTDLKGMYYYNPTVIASITTYGVIHFGSPIN